MIELVTLGAAAIVIITLTLQLQPRAQLITALLTSALLSGAQWGWLNQTGITIRRVCIILLALLAIKTSERLPLAAKVLGCASVLGLVGSLGSGVEGTNTGIAVTLALLLLHWPAAKTLADWLVENGGRRLVEILVLVSAAHLALTALALGGFERGSRFAGIGTSSVLFAFIGASLSAGLLAAVIGQHGRFGQAAFVMLPPMAVSTVASAQRSGLLLLASALLPFVVVTLARRPRALLSVFSASAGLMWLIKVQTGLLDFAFGRFANQDNSARSERWAAAWKLVQERPLFGWGVGFRETIGFGVHNSFLSLTLELGLVGAGFWIAAILLAAKAGLRALRTGADRVGSSMMLASSWLVLSVAGGLVEDKLYRPSNFPALVFLLAILLSSTRGHEPSSRTTSGTREVRRSEPSTTQPNVHVLVSRRRAPRLTGAIRPGAG